MAQVDFLGIQKLDILTNKYLLDAEASDGDGDGDGDRREKAPLVNTTHLHYACYVQGGGGERWAVALRAHLPHLPASIYVLAAWTHYGQTITLILTHRGSWEAFALAPIPAVRPRLDRPPCQPARPGSACPVRCSFPAAGAPRG